MHVKLHKEQISTYLKKGTPDEVVIDIKLGMLGAVRAEMSPKDALAFGKQLVEVAQLGLK